MDGLDRRPLDIVIEHFLYGGSRGGVYTSGLTGPAMLFVDETTAWITCGVYTSGLTGPAIVR